MVQSLITSGALDDLNQAGVKRLLGPPSEAGDSVSQEIRETYEPRMSGSPHLYYHVDEGRLDPYGDPWPGAMLFVAFDRATGVVDTAHVGYPLWE